MTDDTTLTAPAPEEIPLDIVVALSPAELPAAQAQLMVWCDRQRAALQTELADLDEHRLLAVSNGWKLTSVVNQVRRAEQRLRYYVNIKAALEAGYLLVPNMPVDLLAVRVARGKPRFSSESRTWKHAAFPVTADLVPLGEGRYVDETQASEDASYTKRDAQGKEYTQPHYIPVQEYDEPDFPVRAVKPSVLKATQRAMALRLFDEIGLVRQDSQVGGRDPIIVGRVRTDNGRTPKVATFFIAWWLAPEAL